MKILRISKTPLPAKASEAFADFGMAVTDLSPALLSAMTSMKIAKAIKNENYDVVMVDSMDNAMGAISTRKLNPEAAFRLVYYARPDSEVPKSIHKDIRAGVDGWLLPSQRLCDLYPQDLKCKTVVVPVSLAGVKVEKKDHSVPVILWIGAIAHPDSLREAIEEVDAQGGRFILRIAGAGQAKTVMPLVRLARSLVNSHRVQWVGESYDIASEMGGCDAVLYTAPDITSLETIAVQNAIPVVHPSEIGAVLDGENFHDADFDLSAATYLSALRSRLLYITR